VLQLRWKEVIEGTAICAVRLASPREPEEDLRIRHRALTAARRAQSLIMRRDYFDV